MTPALAASVWSRFLEHAFYHNALIAGLAMAVACGLLSVFVVQKRMAFIGQGISHAAFGGVGAALLAELWLPALGRPLLRDAVIAAFCVATALLIGRCSRGKRVSEDSAIGIALVAAMALGMLLLDLRKGLAYTPSFHSILFGGILQISRSAVWIACVEASVVVTLVGVLFKELVFFTCDEEAAEAFGVPTGLVYYGLLVCIAITIVVAMRLLGVILSSALFVLPGAIAGLWSSRIGRVTWIAVLSAALSVAAGLFLAIAFGRLSTGPLIVLTLCCVLGVSWLVRSLRERCRRGRPVTTPPAA
jgi:ABC-type Mn2+/Zn2+ transport system permease subunit